MAAGVVSARSCSFASTSYLGGQLHDASSRLHFRSQGPCQHPVWRCSAAKEGGGSHKRGLWRQVSVAGAATALSLAVAFGGVATPEALAVKRPTGVNRPELLPKEFTTVIDVAGFLSPGQEARIAQDLKRLEADTGIKLRVLAQNYPETPGLAIKDYWKVDDSTVVFVADPSLGNILNFNVGAEVDLRVPNSFWSRLAGKYGNLFYWRENGEDASIEAAIRAIDTCLREPAGPLACSKID